MLVREPELGEHVPDYTTAWFPSASLLHCVWSPDSSLGMRQRRVEIQRTPIEDPHLSCCYLGGVGEEEEDMAVCRIEEAA